MKVQCESCKVNLNIPDEKAVPGQEFTFTCPKCKTKNTIHIPAAEEAHEAAQEAPPPPPPPEEDFEEEEEAGAGEFFEEGAKPALICFDEGPLRENLAAIMTDMGYIPVLPLPPKR